MKALIANYSTPSEIQLEYTLLATYFVSKGDKFRSPSLSINIDYPDYTTPRLNNRIFKLLEEFSTLEDNWDEEGASAPNSTANFNAIKVSKILEKGGQSIYNAAPGPNGEVMLDIRNISKAKSVELIFYPNRSIVVYFPDEGNPYQLNFHIENLPSILDWVNK